MSQRITVSLTFDCMTMGGPDIDPAKFLDSFRRSVLEFEDGRHLFSVEMVLHGLHDVAKWAVMKSGGDGAQSYVSDEMRVELSDEPAE